MNNKLKNPELEKWKGLLQELSFGFPRDRGTAIVVVSYIEELIEEKLITFLNKGDEKIQKTLFERNGSFSTFSSKIDFLYCIGVVSSQVYRDLDLFRKIRNEFAHGRPWLDFDDEKMMNRIRELNSYKFIEENRSKFKIKNIKVLNNRAKYQISVTLTIMWLREALEKLDCIGSNIKPNTFNCGKFPSDKSEFDVIGKETIQEIIQVKGIQGILKGIENSI